MPFQFLDASIRNPTSWLWDFGDGSPTSTEQNPIHTYTSTGPFTVTLKVTNAYDSTGSTASRTINFKPLAGFTTNPDPPVILSGASVAFTNTSTGTAPLTYAWSFGDGGTSTAASPTHTFTGSGPFTVTLKVTNSYDSTGSTATTTVNVKPTASFTTSPSPAVIQSGSPVAFTNTSVGTAPLAYTWDFGDGSPTSSEASPTHAYTGSGPFTVTLTVTNAYDSTGSTATTTVNLKPLAAFTTDPSPAVIQSGGSVAFTNTSTGNTPLTYAWNFGDGNTSSEASPTHTFSGSGPFTVTLKVTNSYDSTGSTATTTVGVKPVASFTTDPSPAVIQSGSSVTFTDTSTGSGPLTYAWSFGDGNTSTAASPTHTFSGSGPFTVTLKVTNAYDSTGSTATTTVNVKPTASFTTNPSPAVIQSGGSVAFTNTSTGTAPLTYAWSFGDGDTSTSASPTHAYTGSGPFTVTLKVTNAYDSTGSTATTTVNVKPTASFTTNPSPAVIQSGGSVAFTNNSTGAAPLTYAWNFGDGNTSSEASPTHAFSGSGPFTVTLKVTNTYDSAGSTATTTVNVKPTAGFTTSPSPAVIQSGASVAFTNTSVGTAPLTYAWDFGDGSPVNTTASPTHTFSGSGPFTVTLKVTNAYDSTGSTATAAVNLKPLAAFTTSPSPAVIQSGGSLAFTNTSTGNSPLTYAWDFGDGSPTNTTASPTHVFTGSGPFTVTLKVTNAYDSTGSTATTTVNIKPAASFTTSPGSAVIQSGASLAFTNTSVGTAPLTYAWNFGDGSPTNTTASPTHIFTGSGPFTVTLKVTNACDSVGSTATTTVNIKPTASFTFAPDTDLKVGDEITFTNASTGTGALSYTWFFGDGSPQEHSANPTHAYTRRGAFSVTLTVDNTLDGTDYQDTLTKTVNVDPIKADLAVTVDDTLERIDVGSALTYTIVVANHGSADVPNAIVKDTFSPWLLDVSWTCVATGGSTCAASGTGNLLEETVALPAGGTLTYTVTARVKADAAGMLANTATVTLAEEYEDMHPLDNTATDQTVVWGKLFLPSITS